MTLPLFITKNNRLFMAFVCGVAFFLGYSIPNHFHIFEPQLLPLTEFDRAIPLIPSTIFIYMSEYFLFVSAYFVFRDDANRNRYIWSYFGVLFFGAIIFVFWPTTYPRSLYPLPVECAETFTCRLFEFLRRADNPSNCLPSMHVACCYLTAFAFLDKSEPRYKFWIYFVWTTLVALSTLPTKQHYIVDVISGLALSIAGYWVFFKVVKYIPLSEYLENVTRAFRKDRDAQSG